MNATARQTPLTPREKRARDNQIWLRIRIAYCEPELAAILVHVLNSPCGPGCRAHLYPHQEDTAPVPVPSGSPA